jgi:hypothetical protein
MMGFRNRQASAHAIERDLVRLADGTLESDRRERVERLVAASPELKRRLREQRRAVLATRAVAERERAPVALRAELPAVSVEERVVVAPVRRRRLIGRWPAAGIGLAGAVGTVTLLLATLGGGQAGLTVAQAATIAARPASATVGEPRDDSVALPRLRAAGLPFPYWEDRFGWRASGLRRDRVDGRLLTTVFYRRGHELIAYTIVAGAPLASGATAHTVTRAGLVLASFSTPERRVLTWLRRGHTCVLSGTAVPLAALLDLASWRGGGELPY